MSDLTEDAGRRLQQLIRDLEKDIAETSELTSCLAARRERLAGELEHKRRLAQKWRGRVMKAIEIGEDQLARDALTYSDIYEKSSAVLEEEIQFARHNFFLLAQQISVAKLKLAHTTRLLESVSGGEDAGRERGHSTF